VSAAVARWRIRRGGARGGRAPGAGDAVGTHDEARAALGLAAYDAILLDLALPDGDGREILRELRVAGEGTRVLVATARVCAMLRRPAEVADLVLSAGNVALDMRTLTLRVGGEVSELPPQELRVLGALLAHHGMLISREKLEQAVYSFDDEVTPNAIEAAVSRLRRRLEQAGALVTITAMRGLGYILSERGP